MNGKNKNWDKDSQKFTNWIRGLWNRGKFTQEQKEKALMLFLLGIFFLLIATPVSNISGRKQKKEENKTEQTAEIKKEEKDAYIESMENKLEQIVEGMEGAGKVKVMITLKDNGEKILDKDQPSESESQTSKEEGKESERTSYKNDQETVLVQKEGDTSPIVIRELYPDVCGVVVLCEGGEDTSLVLQIKEAVQALFSIDAHKIVVGKLKKQ